MALDFDFTPEQRTHFTNMAHQTDLKRAWQANQFQQSSSMSVLKQYSRLKPQYSKRVKRTLWLLIFVAVVMVSMYFIG